MVRISRSGIQLPFYASQDAHASVGVDAGQLPKRNRSDDDEGPPPSGNAPYSPPARVASVPALSCLRNGGDSSLPFKKRMKRSESSVFSLWEQRDLGSKKPQLYSNGTTKPDEYFKHIMLKSGVSLGSVDVDPKSFLSIEMQQHSSYPQAAIAARNEDLPSLKKLHQEGRNLQCSNKFGESIIHIVCRRSRDDMLAFLISEVEVSLRVRDDLGRTPLHDAAWTERPNFHLVKRLLLHEPDLIFVRDNRGNSPLSYVPRQKWGMWNQFLEDNQDCFLGGLK